MFILNASLLLVDLILQNLIGLSKFLRKFFLFAGATQLEKNFEATRCSFGSPFKV